MLNKKMSDKEQLDAIIKQFFEAFKSSDLHDTNLFSLKNLFMENACILRSGPTLQAYTVDNFLHPRQKILTDGTLTSFKEKEINHSTDIFGSIAQRLCIYEKSGILNRISFNEKGVKMFGFVKVDHQWKISSILWEDEQPDLLISSFNLL